MLAEPVEQLRQPWEWKAIRKDIPSRVCNLCWLVFERPGRTSLEGY